MKKIFLLFFALSAMACMAEEFCPKYKIGDTGEGGGIVFFVSEEPFDVFDGKGGVEKCHYLEVSKEELGVMMTKYSGDHIAKINVAKLLENDEDMYTFVN